MTPNTQRYYYCATKLGLNVEPGPAYGGFKINLGKNSYIFRRAITPLNIATDAIISINKFSANQMLQLSGLPVPKAAAVNRNDFSFPVLKMSVEHLQFPVVVKPLRDTALGDGVICNIPTIECLYADCIRLFKQFDSLIIEEFHGGLTSYRVLVLKNNVIAITERTPAKVTGDGIHSIYELVNIENENRKGFYRKMSIDRESLYCLQQQGLSPESILEKDRSLDILATCNATRGGSSKELNPKIICKENKQILVKAMAALNLNFAGIDIECADISKPMQRGRDIIVEVNHGPSIRLHEELIGSYHISMKVIKSIIYKHPFSYLLQLFKNFYKRFSYS